MNNDKEKSILIHNFHYAGTTALVRDFIRLGYKVYSPLNDWGGKIKYYEFGKKSLDSKFLRGVNLITYRMFLEIKPTHVMLACFEQYNDFGALAKEVGAKIVVSVAGNDQPVVQEADFLICPDVQTFEKYGFLYKKMLWFHPPVITTQFSEKNIRKSYAQNKIYSYIRNYAEYWKKGYALFEEFQKGWGYVDNFGYPGTELSTEEVHKRMLESKFTLYLKDKDCYGQAVLESMALGTPIIANRELIAGKTLGEKFLNNTNSILFDDVQHALNRIKTMTLDEYRQMCLNAMATVKVMTDSDLRLKKMRDIGL